MVFPEIPYPFHSIWVRMIGSCVLWNLARRLFLNTCWGLVSHELSTRTLGLVLTYPRHMWNDTPGRDSGLCWGCFQPDCLHSPNLCFPLCAQSCKKMWCVCWGSNSKEDSEAWALEQTVCTQSPSHCCSLSPLTCKSREILIPPSQRRLLRGLRGLNTIQCLSTVPTYKSVM